MVQLSVAAEGYGVIFELSPSSSGTWTKTMLYSFLESTGYRPSGALIFDSAGNLYGTTENGGDLSCGYGIGCGTVFLVLLNGSGGWSESVLHSFSGGFLGDSRLVGFRHHLVYSLALRMPTAKDSHKRPR